MGPKRERALKFDFSPNAFEVPRSEAIAWLNRALETDFDCVEAIAKRGSEWCQLVHFCTIPEGGIIDLAEVRFGPALSPADAAHNYSVFASALERLQITCEFAGPKHVPALLEGNYSESIDLLHWVKHFVEFMGEPKFYHPKDEREEVMEAAAAKKKGQQQQQNQGSKGGLRGGRQQTARRGGPAVLRRTPAPAAAVTAATAGRVAELEAELQAKDQLAQQLCFKFDTAFKKVRAYLKEKSDVVPDEVVREVGRILAGSMS